jgi:two-component system chemotaxis sensor kinase CheA
MSDYLDPNNEELLKDFYAEAELQVETLEQNILILEQDINNQDAIDEIFRAAHTLKGAAATVQMSELAEFTHIVEDVLDDIRGGKLKVNADITDLLLASIDVVKGMLEARSEGGVYAQDITSLEGKLKGLMGGAAPTTAPVKAPAKEKPVAAEANPEIHLSEYEVLELKDAAEGTPVYQIKVLFDKDNPMNTVGGIQVFASLKDCGKILKTNPDFDKLYEDNFFPEVFYFVASHRDEGSLRKAVTISDVTLGAEIASIGSHPAVAPSGAVSETPGRASPPRETLAGNAAVAAPRPAVEQRVEEETEEETIDENEKRVSDALLASNVQAENKVREPEQKKHQAGGSILRVESKRIDELLNLVSETVINKATFNQVSNLFSDLLNNFQGTQNEYRKMIKELFDALPEYLEKIQKGATVKDVKREINENFSSLITMYDPLYSSLKNTVGKFRSTAQNLGRITSELQEGVMRIRMVPISQIFSRFPRLVRDLSKQLDKDINLTIEGEDTELDKSVIEDLLDPLIHCVRNAIDHGVESQEIRAKAGKSTRGEVLLKASNEGNMILIEIADDGKGIDIEAVRKKAIDRGIIHPNKPLTDVEAFNLIFDAGFSTAQKITNISGRGVGLDVVKKQIEKLNGSVSVQSERGKGTRFIIKIPLTLAIIQGLLVRVGTEIYAIPITAVLDSHRIKPSDIRLIDNYEVFNVRDDVVSLMRLNRLFRIPTDEQKEYFFVVIVGSGDKKMGLIVDALIGEEDVVIKPLRDHYTNAPGIAGANITGDGTVSLIIDVSQLLELGQKRELEARRMRETSLR